MWRNVNECEWMWMNVNECKCECEGMWMNVNACEWKEWGLDGQGWKVESFDGDWMEGGGFWWRVDGGWRVLMESGWRVEGFDGEWMEGGGFRV